MKIALTKSEVDDLLIALDDAIASREEEIKCTSDSDILECCDAAEKAITHIYQTILEQAKQQGY